MVYLACKGGMWYARYVFLMFSRGMAHSREPVQSHLLHCCHAVIVNAVAEVRHILAPQLAQV